MTGLIAPDLLERVTSRPSDWQLQAGPTRAQDTARKALWRSIPTVVMDREDLDDGDFTVSIKSTRDFCDFCGRMTRMERLQLTEYSGRLICTHCRDRLRETDYETFQAENDACHRAIDEFEAVYRPLTSKLPDTLDIISEVYP